VGDAPALGATFELIDEEAGLDEVPPLAVGVALVATARSTS
jgi:hypothetical protein